MIFFSKTLIIAAFIFLSLALNAQAVTDEAYIDEETFFNEDIEQDLGKRSIRDPFKKLNKKVFRFNDWMYRRALAPLARGYRKVMPDPAEKGVRNFIRNIKFPIRLVGSLLQGKVKRASKETGAFIVNSTLGIGGLFRPAKDIKPLADIPAEDLGQAFAKWGINDGVYIVLPILGPTSLRDGIARLGTRVIDPLASSSNLIEDNELRILTQGINAVAEAGPVLEQYEAMTESSVDPYEAIKDAYKQHRDNQIKN